MMLQIVTLKQRYFNIEKKNISSELEFCNEKKDKSDECSGKTGYVQGFASVNGK